MLAIYSTATVFIHGHVQTHPLRLLVVQTPGTRGKTAQSH